MNEVRCSDCANLSVIRFLYSDGISLGRKYGCNVPGEKYFDPIDGWSQSVVDPGKRNAYGDCVYFSRQTKKPSFLRRLFGKV